MKIPRLGTDTTSHVHILGFKQLFVSQFYGSQASEIMENAMNMQEIVDIVVHTLHDKKLLLSKALYVAHDHRNTNSYSMKKHTTTQRMKLVSNQMFPDILHPSPVWTSLDVGHLGCKVVKLLLHGAVFLDRILISLLQLGVLVLKCLNLPLVVPSLDVGLAEPECPKC